VNNAMEAMVLRHLFSTGPAELLIASIWQGLCLTALTWIALKLAPGLRASTRFALWLMVFLLVALLPCFGLGHGLFAGHPLPLAAAHEAGYSLHVNSAWAFALEGAWVFASLFSLVRLFWSGREMRSLLRNSVPVSDLNEEIQSVLQRPGSRSVAVRLSDAVDVPSVVGFFRPAVVVPASLWHELAPEELKQILQHEVAHLERRDDWTNLLQKLLRALFPLNPALSWAERNLCLEREQACDDAVLDAAGNARAYATCLTKLAESRMVRRVASLAPGLWRRHSELAGRVENILHRRRALGPLFSGGLIAVGLLTSLSGVFLLQRCPRIITFASNDVIAATAPVAIAPVRNHEDLHQARYQEATYHPAVIQPRPRASQHVSTSRQIHLLQVREDEDGEGITLVLYTVEVPQTAPHASIPIPTPDNWIAFQI
jgi:beta-lactamase regulating signal transducer with metallopeptidase domain